MRVRGEGRKEEVKEREVRERRSIRRVDGLMQEGGGEG